MKIQALKENSNLLLMTGQLKPITKTCRFWSAAPGTLRLMTPQYINECIFMTIYSR